MKDGGIDIGGTKIRWVVVRRGTVVASRELATPARADNAEFAALLRSIMSELVARGARTIGMSVPGSVAGSVILHCRNIPNLRNLNVAHHAPTGMRVFLDNDARCFARAEADLGAGRDAARGAGLFIILGTGIGRALVRGRRVQPVARFEHSEPWEPEYQRRKLGSSLALAKFIAPRIADIARGTKPAFIVLGGGTMRKPLFFLKLKKELRASGIRCPVRRSRLRANATALGAALLARTRTRGRA